MIANVGVSAKAKARQIDDLEEVFRVVVSSGSDFVGRSIVVTGGGSGIGRSVALLCAAAGAAITVTDLNEDSANLVADAIGASGGQALPIQLDVTDENALRSAVATS